MTDCRPRLMLAATGQVLSRDVGTPLVERGGFPAGGHALPCFGGSHPMTLARKFMRLNMHGGVPFIRSRWYRRRAHDIDRRGKQVGSGPVFVAVPERLISAVAKRAAVQSTGPAPRATELCLLLLETAMRATNVVLIGAVLLAGAGLAGSAAWCASAADATDGADAHMHHHMMSGTMRSTVDYTLPPVKLV